MELGAAIIILMGTVYIFFGAIGFIRLQDLYNRAHALSNGTSIGVNLVMFGTFLFFLIVEGYPSIKLLLGLFFVFLTSPVSFHVVLRAAYLSNVKLAKESVQDDLKNAYMYRERLR